VKRFWKQAAPVLDSGRYTIRLDGRPMRLPGGPILTIESRVLAEAIAEEWQLADGRDFPLTQVAGTAQERVAPDPAPTIEALTRYAESDLLCYRAATPEALAARQAAVWQPWLDWAEATHGARLRVVSGVMHAAQPQEALVRLREAVAAKPVAVLAGLGILVPAMGSLVLGLAVAEGALDPAEAHGLAALDELFQAEQWGDDPEALHRRRNVARDIATAARFIALSSASA